MKIRDILEDVNPDLGLSGQDYSQRELETLFNVIANERNELDKAEIKGLGQQMEEKGEWLRGVPAAELALGRMHVLYHGIAPTDESESRASKMIVPSLRMEKFAKQKEIDVEAKLANARQDLKMRRSQKRKMIPQPEARKMMADWAKENRHMVNDIHRQNVAFIVHDIRNGLTPLEAFQRNGDAKREGIPQ